MVLYVRAFSTYFDWDDMALYNPEQYLCSKEGTIFDGTEIINDYRFLNISTIWIKVEKFGN